VNDVSFSIRREETLGLCGESGCGKSTLVRCIARLCQPTDGMILFAGLDISSIPENRLRNVRSRMSLIFQDPYSSLDPRQKICNIISEPLKVHRMIEGRDYKGRVRELCEMVGLDLSIGNRYPHELSGGERQRVGIARALASSPEFIICDEPVSSLDQSIKAQIIQLLQDLRQKQDHLACLFISHDLSVIRQMSDRIAVMYLGRIVEIARTSELYRNPLHPYTKLLFESKLFGRAKTWKEDSYGYSDEEDVIGAYGLKGCDFRRRCLSAGPDCKNSIPALNDIGGGHHVACTRV
jgi:oligopeptide/dipeptide ABC transporter ATP-binding protein